MNLNKKQIKDNLINQGYSVIYIDREDYSILALKARSLCSSTSYEKGGNFWCKITKLDDDLKSVVYSEDICNLYNEFEASPQDVCITFEDTFNISTRNNYLHFDRYRSLKVMTYLEDVNEECGPLNVVKGSHLKGKKLRKNFQRESNYDSMKNRIDIDYPNIKYKLFPIIGPAGTTIFFDSDIFHMGGLIKKGKTRTVIRSHWYKDQAWRRK